MKDRRSQLEAALGHFKQSFAADGYLLEIVSFERGVLHLAIEAEPHACAECLVPPQIMASLIKTELNGESDVTDIRIKYPDGHA